MRRTKLTVGLSALLALSVFASGCDLAALAIRGTVDGTKKFVDEKGGEFADVDALRPVLMSATVTNEGANYYLPEYEPLLLGTITANVGYGILFLQEDAAQAELAGDFDKAEAIGKKAGIYYARALFYAKKMLRLRSSNFDAAVAGGSEVFEHWIDENFFREEDAEALLMGGVAYLVSMVESEDGLAAAVDVPYARYMIEKSITLDEDLMGGMGLMLIGLMECLMPEMLGGRPHLGIRLMEKSAALTDRQNHAVLVTWAERCSVATQDRKQFHSLLMEVIEAKDVPKYRMGNKVARRQAERLLKQADDLFYD